VLLLSRVVGADTTDVRVVLVGDVVVVAAVSEELVRLVVEVVAVLVLVGAMLLVSVLVVLARLLVVLVSADVPVAVELRLVVEVGRTVEVVVSVNAFAVSVTIGVAVVVETVSMIGCNAELLDKVVDETVDAVPTRFCTAEPAGLVVAFTTVSTDATGADAMLEAVPNRFAVVSVTVPVVELTTFWSVFAVPLTTVSSGADAVIEIAPNKFAVVPLNVFVVEPRTFCSVFVVAFTTPPTDETGVDAIEEVDAKRLFVVPFTAVAVGLSTLVVVLFGEDNVALADDRAVVEAEGVLTFPVDVVELSSGAVMVLVCTGCAARSVVPWPITVFVGVRFLLAICLFCSSIAA
jgi:hypothetical protein